VLIVEDERPIAEPLSKLLRREGFRPEIATTLAEARASLRVSAPDVVLLDLMLPDGDGKDLLRELRTTSDVPVVVLTARGEELDRVVGLELGADDYVVKPFSAGELTARLRAILRRRGPGKEAVEAGGLRLDPSTRTAHRGVDPLRLTAKEFDLLHLLMSRAGEVVPREEIMDLVWGRDWFGSTKSLDVHVSWLRKKIEDDPASPTRLVTVRGVGFMFVEPGAAQGAPERG
jgi:two-component system response regulator RegX3